MYFLTTILFYIKISSTFCELSHYIDLSWEYSEETIFWKGVQPFNYTKKIAQNNTNGYWYAMNEFCVGEHGGTHLDAPYHFNEFGWTINEIPIERFITKAAHIDLRLLTNENGPNTQLLPEHLINWETKNGPFENGTVLLVRFGWSQYWPNRTKYLGEQEVLKFPGISAAAAEWIVKTDKFYGVGLDTASVDPGFSTDYKAHRILSKHQLYNLENVKLVEDLPDKDFSLIVMPMKLKHGTGSPVRILAVPRNLHFN